MTVPSIEREALRAQSLDLHVEPSIADLDPTWNPTRPQPGDRSDAPGDQARDDDPCEVGPRVTPRCAHRPIAWPVERGSLVLPELLVGTVTTGMLGAKGGRS